MRHEVIMPALGMAQETGRLVAWLVSPGGAVTEGSPLLEVETDKSVMEVPADRSGYLSAVFAGAGEDVPVGQVIAVISDAKPEAVVTQSEPMSVIAQTPVAPGAVTELATFVALAPLLEGSGRILASPKARRMALQGGLDLGRLVSMGVPQPYHVADIARLTEKPPPVAQPPAEPAAATVAPGPDRTEVPILGPQPVARVHHIAARVSAQGVMAFIIRMQDEGGVTVEPAMIWARFAAVGWCEQGTPVRPPAPIVIALVRPGMEGARLLADPHLSRLSKPVEVTDAKPTLMLRDLIGTRLTGLILTPTEAPELTVAFDGMDYLLGLAYPPAALPDAVALGFMTAFTDRLADPLVHLV